MNSIYHVIVRRLSTQTGASQHYKLVVIGAGCGGLACASKFARKLGKNDIAIIDKNDVGYFFVLTNLDQRLCSVASDAYLPTRLDFGWSRFKDSGRIREASIGMHSIEHHMDSILCQTN